MNFSQLGYTVFALCPDMPQVQSSPDVDAPNVSAVRAVRMFCPSPTAAHRVQLLLVAHPRMAPEDKKIRPVDALGPHSTNSVGYEV